jgi:23S rRNA U2552 (ribose-2'-O)-methylase RlmE/FtsJ
MSTIPKENLEDLENKFIKYNPIIFDLKNIKKLNILKYNNDIIFSNNIAYPEFNLGFNYFIHQAKDKMDQTEKFANRKKIYLVTSLFEKNIDYKEETDDGLKFTSIDKGIKNFIKDINPKFPQILNRAFLKLWEILVMFDLIPDENTFVSSHLAEGPGSFIQATILYREMQAKLKLIKSFDKDKYYGVTLHSDHEHLLMQKEFIKYFEDEKLDRLNILETKSIQEIKDMYGGSKKYKDIVTNGDLTKISTINIFGGAKDNKGYAEPSDLITADGGFDWKKENLQEQEAYRLIFSEIVAALKLQKNGGNFVIKIFESFTKVTIKMIELLRVFYKKVYLVKPYTSRISNSEKYVVCKDFDKSLLTAPILKKLEDMILSMNKNELFNIIDIFTDCIIDDHQELIKAYKNINLELLLKQYTGINNIIRFINLDNYNDIDFNTFLDKQIEASHFWNNTFLNDKIFKKINKICSSYDYFKFINENSNIKIEQKLEKSGESGELGESRESRESEESRESQENKSKKTKSIKNNKSIKRQLSKKAKKINQKGGNIIEEKINYESDKSINSEDEVIGYLSDKNNSDIVDLANINI